MNKIKVGILGPGNVGIDLLHKIMRSSYLEADSIVGIKLSTGIEHAKKFGIDTSTEGIQYLLTKKGIDIVFDCTSASAHMVNAPLLKKAGKFTIDLTPAAVGPYVIPAVSLNDEFLKDDNVNMVTCAGQAMVPIVAAINEVSDVKYAEVVSSISSRSAGPGTRLNIDEFTVTTRNALVRLGGADEAKVIIVINPAEPPINMRNTLFLKVKNNDLNMIKEAVNKMVEKIREYVPGYSVLLEPIIQGDVVTTMIQVKGLGDYLPVYSGNLDIITCAAVNVAERYSQRLMRGANYEKNLSY